MTGWLLWAALVAAQGGADPGIVRGRVLRDAGRPLPQAVVQLVPVSGGFGRSVQSGLDGSYEIAVRAGQYRLVFSKPGYLTLEYGQRHAFEHGVLIDVAAGTTRDRLNITLPRPGAIEGHVVDQNGDPLEHVSV